MNQNNDQSNYRDIIKNKNLDSKWVQYGPSGFNGFQDQVARRLEINIETFLVGSISLLVFALALLLDKLALFILGLLIAPILSPILGLIFGINIGSFRFIKIGLWSFLLNIISFFIVSGFSGFIARQFPEREFSTWKLFIEFEWTAIILLIVGILIMISTILKNPRQSSLVANVALAYCFYLPLISAGFAFGLGFKNEFLSALKTFFLLIGIAIILGVVVLFLYKIRPTGLKNSIPLILFLGVIGFGLVGYYLHFQSQRDIQTSNEGNLQITQTISTNTSRITEPINTPVNIETKENNTTSVTLEISSATEVIVTDTVVLAPTNTATITLTPLPEVVWAEIQSPEGNGANIRQGPGFSYNIVKTVLNGTAIQVLENVEVVEGVTWIQVRFIDGVEGWIVRNLIVSATPEAEW